MSSTIKLQQAFVAILLADYLMYEATNTNETLQSRYGLVLLKIRKELETFVNNPENRSLDHATLSDIINDAGKGWIDLYFDVSVLLDNDEKEPPTTYFPEGLKNWIEMKLSTDHKSTNSELVKAFIAKGIQRNIARDIITGERRKCLDQGKKHIIDFYNYEPEDDRKFNSNDVLIFASYIGSQANNAGLQGKSTVNGLFMSDFVGRELDKLEGDRNYETWVPVRLWPRGDQFELENKTVESEVSQNEYSRSPQDEGIDLACKGGLKKPSSTFNWLLKWFRW